MTIGLLNRLKLFLPFEIFETLHHSRFPAYLYYIIELWYGKPQNATDRVSVLEKKALSVVTIYPTMSVLMTFFSKLSTY